MTTEFVDNILSVWLERATTFDKERFLTAQREIIIEVLSTKYEMPIFQAALILLSSGTELLQQFENVLAEKDPGGMFGFPTE